MSEEKTIYDLELHELLLIDNTLAYVKSVMRVPGGWIYSTKRNNEHEVSVFVPYSEEFKD